MKLDVGNIVWVPCEVKPGPFSSERRVRISSPVGEWIGFVPVQYLHEPIVEGRTTVRVRVVGVQGESFSARVPGQSITNPLFGNLISEAQIFDPV